MTDWQNVLNGDPIPWLLEPDGSTELAEVNPSVRYFTLRDLLDRPQDDAEVTAAKAAIMTSPPASDILAAQRPDGSWQAEEQAYNPMYKSTVWQVVFLEELAADGEDERVRRGVEHVFATMQAEDGSFPALGRAYHGTLLCMEGNVLGALLGLGYGEDPRTQRAMAFLLRTVEEKGFACRYNGDKPCAWGAVKILRALAKAPSTERTPEVEKAIALGADLLLSGDLATGDYPNPKGQVSKHWFKFSFPRSYHSDILEALGVLAQLGCIGDKRLRPAVDFMLSRQGKDGRWKSAHVLTGRLLVDLDKRGGPSKWITLNALRVLKQLRLTD